MLSDYLSTVDWSRAQFAMTAIYHWLFVPLTLGLGFMIAIMETLYVRTKDPFWLRTTKFWMRLFGINFAIGVATGLWNEINYVNLKENILPTRERASLILTKSEKHAVDQIRLRK